MMTAREIQEAAAIFRRKRAAGEITVQPQPDLDAAPEHGDPAAQPLPGEVPLIQYARAVGERLGIKPEHARKLIRQGKIHARMRRVNQRVIFVRP